MLLTRNHAHGPEQSHAAHAQARQQSKLQLLPNFNGPQRVKATLVIMHELTLLHIKGYIATLLPEDGILNSSCHEWLKTS